MAPMYFDMKGKEMPQHTHIVIVELVDRKTSKKYISPLLSREKHVPLMDGSMNDIALISDFVFWEEALSRHSIKRTRLFVFPTTYDGTSMTFEREVKQFSSTPAL